MVRGIWSTDSVTPPHRPAFGAGKNSGAGGLADGNGCPLWVGRVHAGDGESELASSKSAGNAGGKRKPLVRVDKGAS